MLISQADAIFQLNFKLVNQITKRLLMSQCPDGIIRPHVTVALSYNQYELRRIV